MPQTGLTQTTNLAKPAGAATRRHTGAPITAVHNSTVTLLKTGVT